MIRTQIQLAKPDYERLREAALRQRRSMADCIREGIALFLTRSESSADDLADVAGKFRPLAMDQLTRHDRWLAEAVRHAKQGKSRP